MKSGEFNVLVIRKARGRDYEQFWKKGERVNDKGEKLRSDELAFIEKVEARNLKEAVHLTRTKYPNDIVTEDGSHLLD